MVHGPTFGIETAGSSDQTRIGTLSRMTFLIQWAIIVSPTSNVTFIGFADMSEMALVISPTFNSSDTSSVDTSFSGSAFVVPGTDIRYLLALQNRVSGKTRRARAKGLVTGSFADSVNTASRTELARILASTRCANLIIGTILIVSATRKASVRLANLGCATIGIYDTFD